MANFKLYNQNKKRELGFTFIELILYTALVSIFLTSAVYFAWNIIYGQVRSDVQQEVSGNLRVISERIQFEIRNAKGINSLGDNFIELDSGSLGITVIALADKAVQITQGGETNNLTSNEVEVKNLSFTNLTTEDQKSKNIKFSITIRHKNPAGKREWEREGTIETTAELRSN